MHGTPALTGQVVVPAPALDWRWQRFAELSGDDVYDLLALRSEVFVVEQQCVFADADGCDRASWHLLGHVAEPDGTRRLGAYLRCIDPGIRYPEPSIGRVVVSSRIRNTGSGRLLMTEGIARSRRTWPGHAIVIGAQQRLERFYGSLGFVTEGMPYDEDGIQHVRMRLRP